MPMRRLLIACICLLSAFAVRADIVDIDSAGLEKLKAAGVPVIDVRTAAEWQETGIVAGSHLLTYFDDNGQADPPAWLRKAKAVSRPDAPVVIICRSGRRSRIVARFLSQEAGYAKIYNVKDGIQGWAGEHRPLVSPAPALAACAKSKTC